MILDKADSKFIKANRDQLKRLFGRRIEELKQEIFNPALEEEEKLKKIKFVQEFSIWLRNVDIFSEEELEANDNFI